VPVDRIRETRGSEHVLCCSLQLDISSFVHLSVSLPSFRLRQSDRRKASRYAMQKRAVVVSAAAAVLGLAAAVLGFAAEYFKHKARQSRRPRVPTIPAASSLLLIRFTVACVLHTLIGS